MKNNYLESVRKQFEYYKLLGDKAMAQVPQEKLTWQFNQESNSIALIVKHLSGNMLSRWTDFLDSDGEKEWRNRDEEFEGPQTGKEELLYSWEKGWTCLFNALESLNEQDLDKLVYIRNMGHTVTEAINRQLAHYPYHVGQIVFLAKMLCTTDWVSLSIPRGNSKDYNTEKFSKAKHTAHFTEELIRQKKV
ncbi:DUF1572 domain-containing protein [Pedobacter nutrimenti]|uniref:Uncharacterized protein DUF1572 n=1 Tax=Pedobacter nutrimenti TaxID=1241337 RepID=A0A318UDR8_9SPHI|nr:DUF1572 domain-containing protein [Pedobacter nutrimenti]PYF71610.1 uncharacterized protein DUF1572 [Pedobacter nutrimenti]